MKQADVIEIALFVFMFDAHFLTKIVNFQGTQRLDEWRLMNKIFNAAKYLNYFIWMFVFYLDFEDSGELTVLVEQSIEEMLNHIPLILDDVFCLWTQVNAF